MRILLVEDEPEAARVLAKGLREQAYAVDVARDGMRGLFQAETNDYDAIILDVMLPRRDGLSVCRALRESGSRVPVIMLTARDKVDARVQGLDIGADDYLVKPYDFRELLARLRALIRRGQQPLQADRLSVGDLTIDARTRTVTIRDEMLTLTAKEYALLEFLIRQAGTVVSRADISEHVWDEHYDPLSNVVDVYIQRLRKKLDRQGQPSIIRTHRGAGYQLTFDPDKP